MTTLLDVMEREQLTDFEVIDWGCPVPFFGHLESSHVATVGINPSNREFVGLDGAELSHGHRRFPTLGSLGLSSWAEADFSTLRSILSACREYFERNPYDGWFGALERLITPTGCSFYRPQSNACHLDVVPWATVNKWGRLAPVARKRLVDGAAAALAGMIARSPLEMLVLNGQEVVRHFEALLGRSLPSEAAPSWDLPRRSGCPIAGIAYRDVVSSIAGYPLERKLLVVGYNHNLQSSFGVTTAARGAMSGWIGSEFQAAQ